MFECNQANYNEYFNKKIINDPIYGCIGLSELEIKLLDTPAMQRLRRIKQMGFSSYVFPGGEHSRFTHSLGVLYIMGRMCDKLYRKKDLTEDDVVKLRIAALLHDVGHYPFSHLTEMVYTFMEKENSAGMINEPTSDTLNLLSKLANHSKKQYKYADHEHLGKEVICKDPDICCLLDDAEIDKQEIGQIITGEIGAKNNSTVYAQLMHSSLDADRMDYLLRDSSQAGVVFGNVDFDYIVNNMTKAKYETVSSGSIDIIAIKSNAQHAVEHFLISRYFHYLQTVQHKTSSSFEASAKLLLYHIIKESGEVFFKSFKSLTNSIGNEDFYSFTDDYMWSIIKVVATNSKNEIVKMLWDTI